MTHHIYTIQGMDCADCAVHIEKGVRQIKGVQNARVDYATGLLQITGEVDDHSLQTRMESLGYSIQPRTTDGQTSNRRQASGGPVGFWRYIMARTETRLALAGGLLVLLSFIANLAGAPLLAVRAVQVVALVIAGFPVARAAATNLWINHDISINLLMTIAAVGAVMIGETAEAATLIFLFAISEALEGFTADRARRVLDELGNLAPDRAVRIRADGEEEVLASGLRIGDQVLVRAGERIPTDGLIRWGESAVNQAPITGESLPIDKAPGDEVFAGTVNGSGTLIVDVTCQSADTTIQRIIRMIEQAQSVRAPTQRFIDRFARIYTPAVVVLAALIAIIPPVFFGQPFLNPAQGAGWLYRALTLLVISCPCALVISAPVTIISAITAAARRGVLIKGGAYLEALAGIQVIAFDKTGTLTRGQPEVTTFHAVNCAREDGCKACDDVLALASALESRSTHPLARSVLSAAEKIGVSSRYAPAGEVVTLAGLGLQGQVNGKLATVGNHTLFDRDHPHDQALCDWIKDVETQGQTAMLVCDGDQVRGYITVADVVREDSREAVAALRQMGLQTAMLTGDNATVAHSVGAQIGIDHVEANLLPQDKVNAIRALSGQYGRTAMVGDGINDSPALAAAALGVAMGGAASSQAMETADVVLMSSDLHALPFSVRLSRFARRLIHQNVAISLATKLVFVLLALSGLTSLWLAVLADVGVSLVVTANGLRANRFNE